MNPRAALILMVAVGAAAEASGQEVMQVSYTWSEVVAGTLTPVGSPNSVLEPGEGARIGINIFAMINGTNAVGQTTMYSAPPSPGFGTVRGISFANYYLYGDGGANTAAGDWSHRAISPALPAGSYIGNLLNAGATIDSFGGGQFVAVGQAASPTNPISDLFRGVWSPATYTARTVNFKGWGYSNPSAMYNGILVQYGTAFTDPTDPTTAYPLYVTKYILGDFGAGINIPIVPAPACGLVLAGVAAISASRRRRR